MNEPFLFLMGLMLLVGVIGVPILLAVALARISRLERRLLRIEKDTRNRTDETATSPRPVATATPTPSHLSAPAEKRRERVAPPAPGAAREHKAPDTVPKPQTAKPVAPVRLPAQPGTATPQKTSLSQPAPLPRFSKPIPEKKPIRWEEWIGVRGAAILGGAVLALAGIFLFRHALENGWIDARARVGTGIGVGSLCILLAQYLRKKRYGFAPSALEGGGLVALYAATWAADRLYGLIPQWASFGAMALVTALACFLALRSNALLTAVIGLFGGFATPLLLSSMTEDPLQLFGYIAVLDVALLALGSKRRWPSLGLLALFGTFLVQAFWMLRHLGGAGIAIGALIVGLFALLFALSGKWLGGSEESRAQTSLQATAILFPFLFALYFASSFELASDRDFYSTAGLLVLLQTAACVLAVRKELSWLPVASSAGAMGVTGIVWLRHIQHAPSTPGWVICGVVATLILIPLAFAEFRARRRGAKEESGFVLDWTDGSAGGLLVAAALSLLFCGVSLVLAEHTPSDLQHLSVLALVLGVSLYAIRRGVHVALSCALSLGLGIAMALRHGVAFRRLNETVEFLEGVPYAKLYAFVLLLPALLLLAASWREREGKSSTSTWSSAFYLGPLLIALPFGYYTQLEFVAWWPLPFVLISGALLNLASTRLRSSLLFGLSAAAVWILLAIWTLNPWSHDHPQVNLVALGLGALLYGLWPILKLRGARAVTSTWLIATGTIPVFALASIQTFKKLESAHPVTTAALFGAALLLPVLFMTWRLSTKDSDEETETGAKTALPWSWAALALFAAVAISARIDIEPVTTTLALWALGLSGIRLWVPRSALLQHLAAIVMALASTLLLARLGQPQAFLRSDSFALNGFTFAYLVPAAAGVLGSVLVYRKTTKEGKRSADSKLTSAIPALCAVLLVFLWINLAIWNRFEPETMEYLALRRERMEQRDLTLSISWALYGMGLLGLGTYLRAGALRWTSLLVLLAAIGKVFLWDLGELEGLFRVGSLAGLAVCLILVSLFYQRFVFGKRGEDTDLNDTESNPPSRPEEDAALKEIESKPPSGPEGDA